MRVNNFRFAFWLLIVPVLTLCALAQEDTRTEATGRQAVKRTKADSSQRGPTRSGASPAKVLADRFDREAPQIGDPLPDISALDAEGHEFPLRSLRGHYTVLTFGCLT